MWMRPERVASVGSLLLEQLQRQQQRQGPSRNARLVYRTLRRQAKQNAPTLTLLPQRRRLLAILQACASISLGFTT